MTKKLEGAGLRGQVAGETSLSTVGQIEGLAYRGHKIELLAEKPLKILIERPMIRKMSVQLKWDDPVQAPIKKFQKIGQIIIKVPGRNDVYTNLVSRTNVEELGPFYRLKSAFNYLLFGGDVTN